MHCVIIEYLVCLKKKHGRQLNKPLTEHIQVTDNLKFESDLYVIEFNMQAL